MKNKISVILTSFLVSFAFGSCASDEEEYATQHDPEYTVTYMLTDFETLNNRSNESIWLANADANDQHLGYYYMFDDNKQDNDWVVPHAQNSNMCKDEDGNELNPPPPECQVHTGRKPLAEQDNPFTLFNSTTSFNFHGTAIVSGVGFGVYFADYIFEPPYKRDTPSKLSITSGGKIAPNWSSMRIVPGTEKPLCADDASYIGTVDSEFLNPVTRKVFRNKHVYDSEGLYKVTGPVWTAGVVYVDTDGVEHYELDYDRIVTTDSKESMKEPRCLTEAGQKGFVMWARGNAPIEVALIQPESAPNIDGGICDLDGGEKCYDHQRVVFDLDDEWREYHASWDDFSQEGWGIPVALDPNRIINIQIKVAGYKNTDRAREFSVWLDQIGFYGGNIWEFMK